MKALRYIIEYNSRCQTYRILDYKDKLQMAEPPCIKNISAEAVDKIIQLFIDGFEERSNKCHISKAKQ